MKFRVLVAVPLAWALVFIVADLLLQGTGGYRVFLRAEIELVKGLALIGCLAAAFSFHPGEYLRRAWLFMGGCMLFLLLRDLTMLPAIEASTAHIDLIQGILVVLANISVIIGIFMLAQAWRVAGLELPGTKGQRWSGVVIALLLAAALGGPGLVNNFVELVSGDASALTGVAMALGDMISLILIAPVLFTALALRGGLFGWPWWLLTASLVSWLLYDGVLEIGPYLGAGEQTVKSVSEMFRALACMFEFSAGLAQFYIVRRTKEDTQA